MMYVKLIGLLRAVADVGELNDVYSKKYRECIVTLHEAFREYSDAHPEWLTDTHDKNLLALLRATQVMSSYHGLGYGGDALSALEDLYNAFYDYIHEHKNEWDYLMSTNTTPCPKCGGDMEHIHGMGIDYDHLACAAQGCLGYVELSYSTFPADEQEGIPHAND